MSKNISELLGLMRQEGAKNIKPSFFIGVIVNGFPNIKVNLHGAVFEKDDLKMSKWLLDRENINIESTEGSISHNISDTLKYGDEVLLYKVVNKLIVLDKLVNLNE